MTTFMIPVQMQETEPERVPNVYGSINRAGVGLQYVPVVSVSWPEGVVRPLKLRCAYLLTDADVVWQLRVDGALLQPSWSEPDGADPMTATVADNEAASISGGRIVGAGLCASTTNAGSETEILEDYEVPPCNTVSLCVRKVTGSGATVSAILMWDE